MKSILKLFLFKESVIHDLTGLWSRSCLDFLLTTTIKVFAKLVFGLLSIRVNVSSPNSSDACIRWLSGH